MEKDTEVAFLCQRLSWSDYSMIDSTLFQIQCYFFWTKSIVYYIKMMPQRFRGWLCPRFQVITPTLLGPLEGDNPNLWASWLYFNIVNDGFIKINNIEWNTPSLKPFRVILF
jgi:hypothetical protein